ncbi:universal stress protein [Cupriavidus basilensis]|uniref:universal stress protein n=1 Tax=Cupriavidus basilensis TaxID=68895 RepID=UPI0020A65E35|nr:universal stress protein [Cupriavidus basilensis]MCP3017655.1 universal stress protein [Cupriavidus basilensis]MDR3381397.1 universal stress protein [Cupriavidus basilensis]
MFRHLFVPVDPRDHDAKAALQAIALARSHGARISFRHAQDSCTCGPSQAREVLVRADAAARAQGVACTFASLIAEHPARALLAEADQAGCDAIVLAHGAGDLAGPASPAKDILMHARMPVLSIGAACAPAPIAAIALLHNAYSRLATLLHAWLHLVETTQVAGAPSVAAPMLAAIDYVRQTLHPLQRRKEATLFRRLCQRSEALRAELDELSRQHVRQEILLEDLAMQVEQAAASSSTFTALAQVVELYAHLVWEYRGREEGVILPAARHHLTQADWDALHVALTQGFGHHAGTSPDAAFAQLLAGLAPGAPQGA